MNGSKIWAQLAALGTLAALIIGGTMTLAMMISGVRTDTMHAIDGVRTDTMQAIALLAQKEAADDQRITAIEKLETEHHAEDVTSRAINSQQLNAVIESVSNARVELAKLGSILGRGK